MLPVISFLLGFTGAWLIAKHGRAVGLTDAPSERSSHKRPTPKGGGVGILAAFILSSTFLGLSARIWIPLAIIALVSLWGDYRHISPVLRLSLQFFTAYMVSWCHFQGPSTFPAELLRILPSLLFLVGTANFYNFMDGIDGVAGISAIVGFSLLAVYRHLCQMPSSETFLMLCILAACAGFLPFNVPKAKAFMGDVGSVLLGFLFALMVIHSSHSYLDVLLVSSFLFTFYADELTTMFVRLKRGENLLKAHRIHLYQLLVNELGMPHLTVSLIYGFVQLVVGTSVLLLRCAAASHFLVLAVLLLYFAAFCVASILIRKKVRMLIGS